MTNSFKQIFIAEYNTKGWAFMPETDTGCTIISDLYNGGDYINESYIAEAKKSSNDFYNIPDDVLKWAENTSKILATQFNSSNPFIMPLIRATAEGITKNYNIYSADNLRGTGRTDMSGTKDGVSSWTKPFPKPLLQDHMTSGGGGIFGGGSDAITPLARIYAALFSSSDNGSYIMPIIADMEVIKSIESGQFLTGSIGSYVAGVHCSVCEKPIDWACPDHDFGQEYKHEQTKKKVICGRAFEAIWHNEYSMVSVPAYDRSGIVKTFSPTESVVATYAFPFNNVSNIALNNDQTQHINSNNINESINSKTIVTEEANIIIDKIDKLVNLHNRIHEEFNENTNRRYLINDHKVLVTKLSKLLLELSLITGTNPLSIHVMSDNELDNNLPVYLRQ